MSKQRLRLSTMFVLLALLPGISRADSFSNGISGINSIGLLLPNNQPLNGSGVRIGQVEDARPPKQGIDSLGVYNAATTPTEVYRRDMLLDAGDSDDYLSVHALQVAGVMISNAADDTNSN